MQGIGSLITTIYTQAQQFILPALLVLAIAVGGYQFMIGDHKGAKSWIIGGLVGAAIVLGAQTIASMVSGAVHA